MGGQVVFDRKTTNPVNIGPIAKISDEFADNSVDIEQVFLIPEHHGIADDSDQCSDSHLLAHDHATAKK
jgi:hypothetical protein